MRPLTSSAVTTTFLTNRPFLILNASAFDTRYVGSLLAEGAIKSKGGIALPLEIWLDIFEIYKLLVKTPDYHLARVLTATHRGERTKLSCKVELSAVTDLIAYIHDQGITDTTTDALNNIDAETIMSDTLEYPNDSTALITKLSKAGPKNAL